MTHVMTSVHNSCSINAMLFIFYVNFKNVFIITFLSMGKCYLRKKMIVDIFLNKSIRGRRRRGWQRMRWLDGITDSMDMSLSELQSWWWTGRPGVLQFMGLQRVGHNWATELIHIIKKTILQKWKLRHNSSNLLKISVSQCENWDTKESESADWDCSGEVKSKNLHTYNSKVSFLLL